MKRTPFAEEQFRVFFSFHPFSFSNATSMKVVLLETERR